jgi:hypothetical protein
MFCTMWNLDEAFQLSLACVRAATRVRKRFLGLTWGHCLGLALRLHPDKAVADHPEARDAFAAMQLAFRSMQKRS